ncbi:LysR family transcriptional regulator [Companilactobacillus futsaii]|uniref:LysR family transcriptional regulator n=2 Tax=Companilactobacillus futsaii TaxID=938155 RepID=A0A5B7SVN6_9LACO|nr:LysR family transcriptional regulator [Companilactobacillus futsaii]KRK99577.1 LysR family transcriptional regulator [Companilactobacillus futsaii JCM 17355]QCX23737.1 LysR family transcriptional regulator [Companilactobacillus futsaii]
MIENYLLEELVTFKKYGTLAATAQHLLVTQPTVTRGMQKLEDELGVQIFDRQPNRITLTKTGELAVKEAQKVIDRNNQLIETVQKYDYNHKNITVGSVAPGPLILLKKLQTSKLADTNLDLDHKLMDTKDVSGKLLNHDYSFILTNQELMTDEIESLYIGTERLSVNLNQFTLLANKKSVSFNDLKGLSFIVLSDIGVWKKVAEGKIPGAKFLYQEQREAFSEITKYSDFPYFTTNISKIDSDNIFSDYDQINVPISDEASKMDFYAAYLKNNKRQVAPVLKTMSASWSNYLS